MEQFFATYELQLIQGRTYIKYEDVRDLSSTVDVLFDPIESFKIDPFPKVPVASVTTF